LQVFDFGIRDSVARIDQESDNGCRRQQFVQQSEPLSDQLRLQKRHTCYIATGVAQGREEARLDRVHTVREDDRDC